jgi:hypothetical protein
VGPPGTPTQGHSQTDAGDGQVSVYGKGGKSEHSKQQQGGIQSIAKQMLEMAR